MTVEVNRGTDCEDFPVGLRVLAVDDDPICLKLLDTLLRKCQYHVTTTSQARMALKMLRENQNIFDLVISDVHMPDMDGFKLLELVGLEMDLPVIMLSANGDPKLVMKGVTHGACDYLVKPVRIEELRNIWQHVIRKKKVDPRDGNKSGDQGVPRQGSMENQGSPLTGNTDHKYNRKRKDEEDENEDNENESEDNGTQKKPRVVWSIELHRKFVGAVNHLGIEKAVPKRILDMMNVEGLTRENVASHLQKYRLYLKRISTVASQQSNMAAALGVKDSHFMHMGALDGFGDFRTLSGARLSNVSLSPFESNGMLSHLNSPANMGHLRNLTTLSPLIPPTNLPQDLTNSVSSLGKMNLVLPSSANQNASMFQGIPLELNQLQQHNINNKCAASFNNIENSRIFPNVGTYSDLGPTIGSQMASFNSESFDGTGVSGPSDFIDSSRIHQNTNNPFLLAEPFSSRDNNSSGGGYFQHDPLGLSSGMALVSCEQRQDYGHSSDNNNNKNFSSLNSIVSSLGQNSGILNQKMDMLLNGRLSGGGPTLMHDNGNEKLEMDLRPRSNEDLFMEQPRLQGGFVRQGHDSLDELMNTLIKREQEDTMPSCDFGIDDYAFGQGI